LGRLKSEGDVRGEPREHSGQGEVPAGRAREGRSPRDDPGSKSARALTRADIEALLDATLDNANSTLSAAELLLEQGLLSQAYTLAHLALEEASKVTMLLGSWLGLLMGMTLDWNRFWKAWTSHDDKNQFMIFNLIFDRMRSEHVDPEAPWDPLSSSAEAAALQAMPSVFAALAEQMNVALPQYKALQKKRLSATYVDFRDGRVTDPKTVATKDEVSSLVTAARSPVDWEQLAWANRSPFQDMLPDFAKQVLVEAEKSFASPPSSSEEQ
jgi:AbiV family abortive infection protein